MESIEQNLILPFRSKHAYKTEGEEFRHGVLRCWITPETRLSVRCTRSFAVPGSLVFVGLALIAAGSLFDSNFFLTVCGALLFILGADCYRHVHSRFRIYIENDGSRSEVMTTQAPEEAEEVVRELEAHIRGLRKNCQVAQRAQAV